MLRLRQIAMVTPELGPVEAEVGRIAAADVCYRDPGVGKYGLHNALWALGGTFLEALAPLQPDTTAGRYMARRGGATGYMVILDSDDLAPVRARLAALNMRIVEDLSVGDRSSAFTRRTSRRGRRASSISSWPVGRASSSCSIPSRS